MPAKEIIDTIAEAVAEAWGTLFMKEVGLEADEPTSTTGLAGYEPGDYVSSTITFSGDINGETKIYIPEKEALTMVGMMMSMGADDSLIDSTREGDLGDEELDALNEAFNQFSATAATVLRDKKGCSVSASSNPTEKILIEMAIPDASDEDHAVKCTLKLEGYDNGILLQNFSADLYTSLDGEEGGDSTEEPVAEEATPAAEAPADPMINLLQSKGQIKVKADVVLAERTIEVNQLLTMSIGSVLEFWKPCDDPAEMMIGDDSVAAGEVVVSSDQHFCMRVTTLAPPKKTYQKGTH